eukprot:m51a1_g10585 hypothetical protein (332) ;mRNA; r:50954-59083
MYVQVWETIKEEAIEIIKAGPESSSFTEDTIRGLVDNLRSALQVQQDKGTKTIPFWTQLLHLADLSGTQGVTTAGSYVSGDCDFNGDLYADVLVGLPNGRAALVYGHPGTWPSLADLGGVDKGLLAGLMKRASKLEPTEHRPARSAKHAQDVDGFHKYAPIEALRILQLKGEVARLGVSRRRCSKLFCNIENFTTLTESADPDDLLAVFTDFMGMGMRAIDATGGIVDKFVIDCGRQWGCHTCLEPMNKVFGTRVLPQRVYELVGSADKTGPAAAQRARLFNDYDIRFLRTIDDVLSHGHGAAASGESTAFVTDLSAETDEKIDGVHWLAV